MIVPECKCGYLAQLEHWRVEYTYWQSQIERKHAHCYRDVKHKNHFKSVQFKKPCETESQISEEINRKCKKYNFFALLALL